MSCYCSSDQNVYYNNFAFVSALQDICTTGFIVLYDDIYTEEQVLTF